MMRWYNSSILFLGVLLLGCGADDSDRLVQEATYVDTAQMDTALYLGTDIHEDTLTFAVLEDDRVAQLTEDELELLSQYMEEAQSLPDRMAKIKGKEITVGEAITEQRKRQHLVAPLMDE